MAGNSGCATIDLADHHHQLITARRGPQQRLERGKAIAGKPMHRHRTDPEKPRIGKVFVAIGTVAVANDIERHLLP